MTRASDLAKLLTGGRTLGGTGEVIVKDIDTADGSSPKITLQTGDTDIASADVLGTIDFQAPDEGTGTDAILVAAGIEAVSEGDFSSSSNATSLVLKTGASEAAAEKVRLTSAGDVGIGTTSPSSYYSGATDLVISGSGDSGITVNSGTSGAGRLHFADGTSGDARYRGYIVYDHATDSMQFASGGSESLKFDTNGHVTMPRQPAFLVENSDNQTNMAINTAHVVQLATERFDLNGDFNNSTDTFTAPVTGKYHFDAVVTLINYPIDMTYAFTQISFSNLTTEIYWDGGVLDEVAGSSLAFTHSILMDMDANDTCQLKFFQQDGTASADINGSSSQLTTYLSGHLVA